LALSRQGHTPDLPGRNCVAAEREHIHYEASEVSGEIRSKGGITMVIDPVSALWLDLSRRAEMKRMLEGVNDQPSRRARKRSRKK